MRRPFILIHNSPTLEPLPWWKRLFFFLIQFVLFIVIFSLLALVLDLIFGRMELTDTTTPIGDLIYEWSIPLLAALGSILLIDQLLNKKGIAFYGFSFNRISKSLVTGFSVSSIILLLSFSILLMGDWASISNFNFELGMFFGWLLFFLIQPMTEEIIMRSFLQTQLQQHFGAKTGLLITALAFAAIHGANDHITILALVQIFAGGLMMGLLFLYTQNIWASFAMHASWNFLQSTVLGFAVSGMETYRIFETTTTGSDWITGGDFGLEGSVLTLIFLSIGIIYFWQKTLPYLSTSVDSLK